MTDTRKDYEKITPELYKKNPSIKCDLEDVVFTEESWHLIEKGVQHQQFVLNSYIDPVTGRQYLHCWPTSYEESPHETKNETRTRQESEERLVKSGYKNDEIVRSIFFMTGVVHQRAADLDKKKYDPIKHPYLNIESKKNTRSKTYRMGGQLRKMTSDTSFMRAQGRSTLNWDVFILNEVFESAFYFGYKSTFNRDKEWPIAVNIARSLPFEVIEGWLKAIEKRNKQPLDPIVYEEAKKHCYSLKSLSVSDWNMLFEKSEEERKEILSEKIMQTIYMASGLKKNKEATIVLSDEEIVNKALTVCKKYGIQINLEYIPHYFEEEEAKGATALMHAVSLNKIHVVKTLIAHNANIHATDSKGYSVFDYAILSGNENICKLLLKAGVDISKEASAEVIINNKSNSSFHLPFFKNFLETYQEQKVAQLRTKETKDTFLHLAVQKNHVEIIKLLLKNKIDVNSQNFKGFTALHMAVISNNIEAIQLLLVHKANVELETKNGATALDIAIIQKKIPLVKLFLPHISEQLLNKIQQRSDLNSSIKTLIDDEFQHRKIYQVQNKNS